MKTSRSSSWKQIVTLIRYTDFPKWIFIFAVLLSVVQTLAGLVVPWFTKDFVDQLTGQAVSREVIYFLIGAFMLQAVSVGFSHYALAYVGQRIVASLRIKMWTKVLALPISYFDQNRSGEPVSRITNDTNILMNLITQHLVSFFTNIISIVGAVLILFMLDWRMTLIIVTVTPLTLLIIQPLGRQMYRISKKTQKELASFTSDLNEVVSEIRLVKASSAEPKETEAGTARIESLFRFGRKEAIVQAILAPFMTVMLMAVLVIIIGYGGYRVASGALSAGDLVAFILYMFQIIIPFSQFATFFTHLQKVMGASERLMEMMELDEEPKEARSPLSHRADQPILFEQVSFSYDSGQDHPSVETGEKPKAEATLQSLQLTFPPNRVTAIVGPSGSGKTTLFALLERFYTPDEGVIRYGPHSIHDLPLAQWRGLIGYVSQESPLMAGTIAENIAYGLQEEMEREAIERAATMAYAHDFIQKLPQGYDTEVGERGMKLSGGQRQRIAIARAILRDPQVLLLDEATSSLDSTSEQEVQKALQTLMKDRTTLVIAHRLSTVVDADQIIVLEYGRMTGAGTHQELYDSHALYRELADKQFKASSDSALLAQSVNRTSP
ncbi:ABC transporter ATP-binding protein [Marinicrinis sediminis]|uniref:ABC transporter ATP-binding protein n=1 Tax=Marinicrinis sediminis TaxID=1652465 RepID=A0ABW5RAP9_9BACL